MVGKQKPGNARNHADAHCQHAHGQDPVGPEPRRPRRQHHQADRQQRAQRLEAADEIEHHQHQEHEMHRLPEPLTERKKAGRGIPPPARARTRTARRASLPRSPISQRALSSSASTVPNSTCIRSTLDPRSDTISTPAPARSGRTPPSRRLRAAREARHRARPQAPRQPGDHAADGHRHDLKPEQQKATPPRPAGWHAPCASPARLIRRSIRNTPTGPGAERQQQRAQPARAA
jgi:hypothetical protein